MTEQAQSAEKQAAKNDVTWTDIGNGVHIKTSGSYPSVGIRLISANETLVSHSDLIQLLAAIDFGVLERYEQRKLDECEGELQGEQDRLDENAAEAVRVWTELKAGGTGEEDIKASYRWTRPTAFAKEASEAISRAAKRRDEAVRRMEMARYMARFNRGE